MPYFNIVAATSENTVVTEYEPVKARSDSYQSEAELEQEFIHLLCEQGYEYLQIHTEKDLIANLRKKLEELNNYQFSDTEWEQFFSDAIANQNEGIVEKTRKIQEDYVQVLKRDDGSSKNITLIDKKNVHNNSLQVINQYVITQDQGAKHDNRYDVTVLVNGLPLVHIELKRRGVAIREAFNQITLEELRYILKCLDNEPLKWQTYINLLADTGMRRGEASGLMWSDIDFKEGIITIKRNLQLSPGKGIYTTTPKNGKMRTVDVGDKVLRLLMMLRQEQSEKCISKYVFTQEGLAEPMHPTSPTHYFKVFSKKYEVEDFHPHKLRHTMASLAITNGADVVSVSARLGHSDSAVTLRMYAHANEESKRRAGDIFRNAIGAE